MRGQEITPLKACRPCSKAKVRCDPGPNQACQRCHRLRKECIKQAPGAHSSDRSRTSADVRRLERKLDNMETLLMVSQRPTNGSISNSGYLSPEGQVPRTCFPSESVTLSESEQEDTISYFHQRMAIRFPFVTCPPSMSAGDLLLQRPFLHMVISMVGCQDQEAQLFIAGKVKDYLVEHLVVNGESSLDLFQGFLLYLAWTHIYVPTTEQLCNYLHLLVAQSRNLSLARDVSSGPPMTVSSYMKCKQFERSSGPLRSLDERKAYLGCFYLVTMLSMCLGESEPMQWTSYMEESYQVLEAAAQGESDWYLLRLVDVARMVDKIYRTVHMDVSSGFSCASRGIAIRWLQKELEQLKLKLTFSDPIQSSFLLLHYHNLEIFVNRTALRRDSDFKSSTYPPTQLTTLHECLQSVKAFFDTFFAIPSAAFFRMPYLFWCQLGHGFLILSQISVYDDEDDEDRKGLWDREYARQVIDFQTTVDRLTQKVEDAVTAAREEGILIPSVFGKVASRIDMWREVHARQEETLQNRQRGRSNISTTTTSTPPEDGMLVDLLEMEELMPGMGLEDLLKIGPMWEFLPF
ncbi:Zn(II)2Cys6 transcription factor [Aspergillus saccharolyticus JOP 1030-1]|uniref:Zn(2)-C6 fungal-type domain-containing protein n=1 Tax=Aspergillus saccharolyticus JOP 1030-1 TaxID=1450539 RepID=A0A319ABY6_9EURO|nr:hypothetical protein BP01DRAFT_72677 [Aspergillus saccharolyticus JOP 1030-1]PYH49178.1 hypothetical protein BP01DRAFT_72677 [Aspergillus saccharolyticus JOP 1030-1]